MMAQWESRRASMHMSRFDLNLLISLNALLHEKNVTRAAERVFVTQPAMSVALGKLRDYFNDPLLVRVGRRYELTARGLALAEPVRESLLQAQGVLGTQLPFDASLAKRVFTIMIPDFVATGLLPRLLQRLVEPAPGVKLQLENWCSPGPAHLVNGDVDLLITLDNPLILGLERFPESLHRAYLYSQRWVCVVAADNPAVQGDLTREQFLGLPHVSVRVPGDRQPADAAVRKRLRVDLDVRVATDNVLQIPFLVPGTPLIAVMPEALARQLTGCHAVKVVKIPEGMVPTRRVELFWHWRNEQDPAHAWMRGMLLDAALFSPY
jgi:LysR family transcriptional regulator, nod-box dependent transcriptional activator